MNMINNLRLDQVVRDGMRIFYNQLGISAARSEAVQVNLWARNTSEGSYTMPDNRVGNVAFVVSLTRKTIFTPQVRGFFGSDFRPSIVIIVRPSQLGAQSTYAITRPR